MKRMKRTGKKAFSVLLAVLMVLSSWVFVAPTEAQAAAGGYYVRVKWTCDNKSDGDNYARAYDGYDNRAKGNCIGISIFYQDNNGKTETEGEKYWDLKSSMEKGTGDYTTSSQYMGFPTRIYVYNDHGGAIDKAVMHVSEIQISSDNSTWQTLWAGKISTDSTMDIKYAELNLDGKKTVSSNASISDPTTDNWDYPYAKSFTWSDEPESMTCPATNGTTATQSVSVIAYDQFGVQMFDPTWTVSDNNSSSSGMTVTSGSTATATITVPYSMNIAGSSYTQTGTVTATWDCAGSVTKTTSKTFTIIDAKYTATFTNLKDSSGNDLADVTRTGVYYGSVPTAPTQGGYSIGDNDYAFTGWSPVIPTAGMTANATYTAEYDDGTFVTADYTEANKALDAARAIFDDPVFIYKYNEEAKIALNKAYTAINTTKYLGRTQQTRLDTMTEELNAAIAFMATDDALEEYDAIFMNGDTLLKIVQVKYGKAVPEDEIPSQEGLTKVPDSENHYAVNGWDQDITSITENVLVYAKYDGTKHTFTDNGSVEANCVHGAGTEQVCSCGYTNYISTGAINPDNHENIAENTVTEPTCTETGKAQRVCLDCKKVLNDNIEIPAKGHTYKSEVTTPATCKDTGVATHTCTVCGTTETEIIPLKQHSFAPGTAVAPDCTHSGYTPIVCSVCDLTYNVYDETKPATAHNFGGWTYADNADGTAVIATGVCQNSNCNETIEVEVANRNVQSINVTAQPTCQNTGSATVTYTTGNTTTVTIPVNSNAHAEYSTAYVAAKCGEAGSVTVTCADCGTEISRQEIAALNHSYSDWNVTTEATCDGEGSRTRTCANCGEVQTESIPATGHKIVSVAGSCTTGAYEECGVCHTKFNEKSPTEHDFTNGEILRQVDATCTKDGIKVIKCNNCDGVQIETITAGGHDYQVEKKVAATCTGDGYTLEKCSKCQSLKFTEGGPALGHDYSVENKVVDATCESIGYKVTKCSRCDAKNTEIIPAKGHNYQEVTDTAKTYSATCTTDGKRTEKCENCGNEISEVISKLGHNMQAGTPVDSTCYSSGYTEWTCQNSGCDHKYTIYNGGELADHAYIWTNSRSGNTITVTGTCGTCKDVITFTIEDELRGVQSVALKTAATCTEKGAVTVTLTDGTADDYEIPVNANAHKLTSNRVEPNCTTAGSVTTTCENGCGYNKVETIPAIGHVYGEATVTQATCSTVGSVTRTCTRSGCTDTISATIPKNENHTWGEWTVTKASTNGATGTMERVCALDGTHKQTVTIPAGGHAFDTAKSEVNTEATCSNEGSVTYKCTAHADCGVELTVKTEKIQHTVAIRITASSTCTTKGEAQVYCSVCDETLKTEEIPANGHAWATTETVAATCESRGYEKQECPNCGAVQYVNVVEATEHNYVETKKDPTCTEAGYTAMVCEKCDKIDRSTLKEINPLGHNYPENWTEKTPATCTENGIESKECATCGDEITQVIPKLGHNFVRDTANDEAANCGQPAKEAYKCSNDGCTVTYKVCVGDKTGEHNWSEAWTVIEKATETSIGYKQTVCTVCGQIKTETIPATGAHVLVETSRTDANCEETGTIYYECSAHTDCGVTDEVIIPAKGHSYETKLTKATCEKAGEVYDLCSECNNKKVLFTLDALTHDWDEGTANPAATCTASGTKIYTCKACNETKQEIIPATGHEYEDVYTPATCTKQAYHTYTCSCGDSYTISEGTTAAHNFGDWTYADNEDGTKVVATGKCQNSGCNATISVDVAKRNVTSIEVITAATCQTVGSATVTYSDGKTATVELPIDENAHNYESDYTAPTCSADGSVVVKCQNEGCNAQLESKTLDKTAHKVVKIEGTAATCTQVGLTDGYKCETCDTVIAPQVETPVLAHSYSLIETKNATCTTSGYNLYECSCGDSYKEFTADATGHTWSDWTVTTNPKENVDGVQTRTCSCGATETAPVAALKHNMVETENVAATCTSEGKIVYTCKVEHNPGETCNYSITIVSEKIPHSLSTQVTEATCEKAGSVVTSCSECSYSETKQIAQLKHSYKSEITKEATCTEEGTRTFTCENCNDVKTETIAKLQHTYTTKNEAATCTTAGYTEYTCDCGDTYKKLTAEATGHNYVEGDNTATCTDKGEVKLTCSCGAYLTVETEALGHDFSVLQGTTEANCLDEATATYKCSRCAVTNTVITAEKTGHTWGEWKEIQPATYESIGYRQRVCDNCDEKQIEIINQLGDHVFTESITLNPTCTTTGKKTYTCSVHENCPADREEDIPALGHIESLDYKAPTCEEEGYANIICTRADCPITADSNGKKIVTPQSIPATGHNWDKGTLQSLPTCSAVGKMVFKCTTENCGNTKTEDIATVADAHSYKVSKVTYATCETAESTLYKCEYCTAEKTEQTAPALGHDYSKAVVDVAATCTADGSMSTHCSRCDSTINEETLPKLDHSYVTTVYAPTCTERGYTVYSCKRCEEAYVSDFVDATGHTWATVATSTTPATCLESGTATYKCDICNATKTEITDAPTGHNWSEWTIVAGEGKKECHCENTGCTESMTCPVPTEGHNWDSGVIKSGDEATCYSVGTKTFTCQGCEICTAAGGEKATYTEPVPMLAHNYIQTKTDATCTSAGEVVVKCNNTGCTHIADTVVLPATGHTLQRDTENDVAPDCTTAGKYAFKCADCKIELESLPRPALGHSFTGTETTVTSATCTEDGLKTIQCANCEETTEIVIPKLGHEVTSTEHVDATCTDKGYDINTCGTCGGKYIVNNSFTPALGHKYENEGAIVTVAPTCTSEGTKTYTCDVCNAVRIETFSATVHNYVAGTPVDATCTTSGYTPYTCSNCGDTYNKYNADDPATGHDYLEGVESNVVNATCTTDGSKTVKCNNCSETTIVVIPKLGHNYQAGTTVEASCTTSGYTVYTCKNCNDTYNKYDNNALNHSFTNWEYDYTGDTAVIATCKCDNCDVEISTTVDKRDVQSIVVNTQPTCQADGSATVTYNDGKTGTVTIPKNENAHNYVSTYVAPTCSANGSILVKCDNSGCSKVLEEQTLLAIPHTYDSGDVTKDPTCTEDGIKTFTCSACKATRTEPVPKTGHTLSTTVTDATCIAKGSVVTECSECDYESSKEIPMTAHVWADSPSSTTEATCETDGLEIYKCTTDGCTKTNEVTIPKLGHNIVKVKDVEGNCINPSYTEWECNREGCDHAYITKLSLAKGHDHKLVEGELTFAATCETDGNEHYKCENCDDAYDVVLPKLGHDYQLKETVASTCHSSGYEVYECKNGAAHENAATLTYNVITDEALKDHNWSSWETTDPATCTTDGTKTRKCLNSGCTATDTDTIPATGHDWGTPTTTNVSCTESSIATYTCTCGETKSEIVAVPTGHKWSDDDWTIVNGQYERSCLNNCGEKETCPIPTEGHDWNDGTETKAPTCSEEGVKTYTCNGCSICTAAGKLATYTAPISKKPHTYKQTTVTEVSCTTDGKILVECEVCGEDADTVTLPKTNHVYDDGVILEGDEATCTEEGTKTFTCSACKATRTETVPATGHNLETVVDKATCTEAGSVVTSCSECDYTKTDATFAKLGHDFSDKISHKDPTCTEYGEDVYKCSRCDEEHTDLIAKKAHEYEAVNTPATCTDRAYTTYTCKCGDSYVVLGSAEKAAHVEKVVTEESSCSKAGIKKTICEKCGEILKVEVLDLAEHKISSAVTAPTCTTAGYTTHSCENCNYSYVDSFVPAKGHEYKKDGAIAETEATCTTAGYTTYNCDNCDEMHLADLVPAKGHDWEDWEVIHGEEGDTLKRVCRNDATHVEEVKSPADAGHRFDENTFTTTTGTCLEESTKTFKCVNHENCGVQLTVKTGFEAHKWGEWRILSGAKNDIITRDCELDGCNAQESFNIPATGGHKYDMSNIIETNEGDCQTEGTIIFGCTAHSDCGETFTVKTGFGEHDYEVSKKNPTCTEPGFEMSKCTKCENEILYNVIIPAKGHDYDTNSDGRLDRTDAVYHPATAENQAYYTYTCKVCGDSYDELVNETYDVRFFDEKGNQIGETQTVSYGEGVVAPEAPEKAADSNYHYTFDSWDRDYTSITSDVDIYPIYEKEAHFGGKANCAEQAKCQICNTPYGKLDSTKHDMVRTTVAATCTADGAIIDQCSRCDHNTIVILTASGHNFGAWEVIEEGNCLNEKVEIRKCRNGNCFEVEERTTLVPHTFIIMPGKAATCMNEGYTEYKYCSVCNLEYPSKVIPKIDHRDINGDGECDYCGSGEAKPKCNCMCHSTGFMKFIYSIVRFFWMITGSNKSCSCGAVHF